MRLYAANLGAGGIDYRCPQHLAAVLVDPDNIAAGVTRDDYVPADVDDADARCEACADASEEIDESGLTLEDLDQSYARSDRAERDRRAWEDGE